MGTQEIIILIIILTVLTAQMLRTVFTIGKINNLKKIFPNAEKDDYVNGVLKCDSHNNAYREIQRSINLYLSKNQSNIKDFNIIKDIVDRNYYQMEEEIDTEIPVPLYLGLMGTMAGIFVGVLFLVFSGGLLELLGNTNVAAGSGASGINALLWGVALAMISSFVGILMTTVLSSFFKKAKRKSEADKNKFLTWLESEILPTLTHDITSSLTMLSSNLSELSTSFSINTTDLKDVLENINKNAETQFNILDLLSEIDIGKVAKANVVIYEKLKDSTDDIEKFAEYMDSLNSYLRQVRALTSKLDQYEKRTQLIEDVGEYFKEERTRFEKWNDYTNKSIANSEQSLKNAHTQLERYTEDLIKNFEKSIIKNNNILEEFIDKQTLNLKNKASEFDRVVVELKNLRDTKRSMELLVSSTNELNKRIEVLSKSVATSARGEDVEFVLPRWVKYSIIGLGGVFLIMAILLIRILVFIIFYI